MMKNTHIVCPSCMAVNRLEAQELQQNPNCGKCKSPLFLAQPITLTDANFNHFMVKNDGWVLVDFWAPWCGPCKMMAPAFAQASAQLEPHVRLAKLNTESDQASASQFAIRSIPTLILFHNGKEVARQAGALSAPQIIQWVQTHTA